MTKKVASIFMAFMMFFTLFISTTNAYADSVKAWVSIDVNAFDSKSGLSKMMLSNYSDFRDGVWEDYAAEKQWQLPETKGVNTVYIKVKDKYGNTSDTATCKIDLGNTDVFANIVINSGKYDVDGSSVSITLPENSKIKQMRFSEDNIHWTDWETYSTSKRYTFNSTGTKTLYIALKTEDGYVFVKEFDNVVNIKNLSSNLPKTGAFIDYDVAVAAGVTITLAGALLLYKSKNVKKQ